MIKVAGNIYPSGHEEGNVYDPDGESPTLKCNGPRANFKKASPMIQVKSATKQGFEEAGEGDSINFSVPNSKTRRGRVGVGVAQTLDTQANQGVVVYQKTHSQTTTTKNNETGTLQRGGSNGMDKIPNVLLEGNIRRLTEIECERLQGFPDNWTKFGIYDGVVKEISRTQRYKLCGNAVTTKVVKLVGEKLNDGEEIVLISLFSGIDGFAKGLIDAGFKITHHYCSEIDKHAIANTKYNFPNAEQLGSVTNVSGSAIRAEHPTAKIVITFGWPCQDNSIAGKRKGQRAGTRSGLLSEAGRIISECRPQNFIAENVKGLLSVNDGIDFYEAVRFLSYLDTGSPQYTVEMQLLNTAWLLPQNRERTYFVGHLGTGSIKRIFPITENDFRTIEGSGNSTSVRTITGGG